MEDRIRVEPLPYNNRRRTFGFLLFVFIIAIPFLYLYATGYRLDFTKPTNLISTGGIYVAVERTDAEIYIDDELVRETRTFRRAFYAQNLDVGTHKVHVQKEGHHTWVKELPVSKHLVTEAQAFNLPLVPKVKVFSEFESATGSPIINEPISVRASTTDEVLATTTKKSLQFTLNDEYQTIIQYFSTTSTSTLEDTNETVNILDLFPGSSPTSTEDLATSTIETDQIKLYEDGEDLYAKWIGSFENMPYYYCAEDFPPYSTSTLGVAEEVEQEANLIEGLDPVDEHFIHPVQTVSEDVECDPTILIDKQGQQINDFDFFPGSTDLVIVVLEDGIYVVEIDNRAWQNVQPLLLGENLKMHIENSVVYVYDGTLIYQVILNSD